MKYLHIFKTSFLQVFLVAVNTIFLTSGNIPGFMVASFLISWLWVTNVKKANIASRTDQFVYASGAMIGALTGYYFSMIF